MLFAVRTIHEEKGESVMSVFFSPREVIWGTDVLGELSVRLRGFRKAAIIIGASGSVVQNGSLERLCGTLQLCGMSYVVIDGIRADPSYKQVCEKARLLTETRPECLIALGGGSVIDAAKVMRLRHLYPDADLYTLVNPQTFPTAAVERPLPLIAIPTTSGTGSEITGGAVITDDETMTKLSISNPAIIPELAVVDASFAASMPRALAANTGMDALTHAIEGLITLGAWEMSDMFETKAIEMIAKWLPKAVENPSDIEARDGMATAQYIAGMAFSNVGLGLVHGMAHPLGAYYDIPHGVANALLLPFVMEYNKEAAKAKYRTIAEAMGVDTSSMSDDEAADAAVKAVKDLAIRVRIPQHLSEIGVPESGLPTLAQAAFNDVCTPGNPRQTNVEEILAIYKKAF